MVKINTIEKLDGIYMDIKNLITFVEVAEKNSFTKAAESLGCTQSTVSFQIKQLENELDCKLFDRINHAISLTSSGKVLLNYAKRVREQTDDLHESIRDTKEPSGYLKVVTSDSIAEVIMLGSYRKFSAMYPQISLQMTTESTDKMLDILNHNGADLIITLDNHIYQNDYVIAAEEPVSVHFVTGINSPLVGKKHKINDLLTYRFLLTEKGMSYSKILHDELAKRNIEIKPAIEMGRTDLIAQCLVGSEDISFLPDFITEEMVKEGKLAILEVDGFDIQIWKQLIYHRDKWLSGPLETCIEFIKENEFNK